MTLRCVSLLRAADVGYEPSRAAPFDVAVLTREERHVRRKLIQLSHGDKVHVDFAHATLLEHGDVLLLDDGRHVEIVAADEELYDIRARDSVHLAQLAWHVGNRHLAAQIEAHRILILRDHVIKAMLEGLGATVTEVTDFFGPVRGAYAGAGESHGHGHGHQHDHHDHDGHSHAHD